MANGNSAKFHASDQTGSCYVKREDDSCTCTSSEFLSDHDPGPSYETAWNFVLQQAEGQAFKLGSHSAGVCVCTERRAVVTASK